MSKVKILLTGSGGFVLSNFTRYVLQNYTNYSIVGIDRCNYSFTLNTIYNNKNHEFYIADVNDKHILNRIFQVESPDYVIHGAKTNNTTAIETVIDACIANGVKKLLYLSSDEVYGALPNETAEPFKETSELKPETLGGVYKISDELLLKHNKYINYNIVRCSSTYGPRQMLHSQNYSKIPNMIYNILGDKEIIDSGMSVMDWLHIKDLCNAILYIMENAKENETYNVSSRQEFSNIEVFNEIGKFLNKKTEFKESKQKFSRIALDNDKLLSLGWKPEFKFKSSIAEVVQWYIINRWIFAAYDIEEN